MSSTYEKEFGKGKSKITVPFATWQATRMKREIKLGAIRVQLEFPSVPEGAESGESVP